MDVGSIRAEPLHCRDRRLQNATECTLPASMSRGDNSGLRIGEQDRCTIRRECRNRDTRCRRDEGVRLRHRIEGPGLGGDDGVRAMVLMGGQQVRRCDPKVGCDAPPVFRDGCPVVLRAGPAI